jgi:hypothetical protein
MLNRSIIRITSLQRIVLKGHSIRFSSKVHLVNEEKVQPIKICLTDRSEVLKNIERIIQSKCIQSDPTKNLEKNRHTSLHQRQLDIENDQHTNALNEYKEIQEKLVHIGRGTGTAKIRNVLLQWYEPFMHEIKAEIALVEKGVTGIDRNVSFKCI